MTVTTVSAMLYGGVFILFAPWMAARTLSAPHLAPMLQISAITVALGVVNSVQSCSLAGCEAFRTSSVINIVCTIAQTVLVLIGAWFWKLPGAVAALALSMVATVAVTRWVVTQEWKRFNIKLNWHESWGEWRVLIRYSLPTFLSGLSVGPVVWGCNAMLANQPDGYAQLGIYNAANQWQSAIQFLPALIGTAILPVMSERHGSGDLLGGVRVMKRMMAMTAVLVVPITLLICACSPWIMRGYGLSFVSGYRTLCLSVVTAALLAVMTPVGQYLAASGRMWAGFVMNTGWGICMILAAWLMVHWGAEGLAGASLIAYLIHAVWTVWFVVIVRRSGTC
jgi:O-antigen/teichoic acid export membrane protein